MRRGVRAIALVLGLVMLGGCGALAASENDGAVELFAVNVGKGDALILRVGETACLIDAGKAWARGRVLSALERLGIDRLDAVFLTHADDDHAGGLEWLADSSIPVGAWYASAMYADVKKDKHPMVKAAGKQVNWLRRGDAVSLGNGATFNVLAPASRFDDDDDNSLVMMLESPQGRMLLTGDMELPEEAELLGQGDDLKCAVLKAPNHGDGDTVSKAFANACAARIAVISTDGAEKPGTPDPGVVSRLEAAGGRVVVTQDSELGILVTLEDGVAAAEYVDFDAPFAAGVSVIDVDAGDDTVTLRNDGGESVSLDGWYLYSDKGGEMMAFSDVSIAPGTTLTVGTNSTDGDYDVLWDDKKVIKKKNDAIYLYDRCGRLVSWMEGGH